MSAVTSCRRLTIAAAAALAAAGTTASPALAGPAAPGCAATALSNPFAPWGDGADYQLLPGGDVEDAAASWSLSGGAAAQEGNEPFMVTSASDHLSLRVPASGAATTDRMCVGAEHSHFRFFVKRNGGSAISRLLVEVVFDDAGGRARSVPVGLVDASASWAPTYALPTIVNLLVPLSGNTVDVAFRFRPLGGGTWSIDDVYVDPYRTR